jgi:hypothetical protein
MTNLVPRVARGRLEKILSGEQIPTELDIIMMAREILQRRDKTREKMHARPALAEVILNGISSKWSVNDQTKVFTINIADRWYGCVYRGSEKNGYQWNWTVTDSQSSASGKVIAQGVSGSATSGRLMVEGFLKEIDQRDPDGWRKAL